ncbi:DUF397 domain-containing protein [Lentzea sp. NPDC006480]|uniref:DUF397 domain-containing protein n=1 Tax=Lentzea sp. NPDC006480 TaxID=3157176 RepID=UPI0033A2A28E
MAAELTWKRSSYSGSGESSCVELARGIGVMWVRDSKDRGLWLAVSFTGWRAFLALARS